MRIPQELGNQQNNRQSKQPYIESTMIQYEEEDELYQVQTNTIESSVPSRDQTVTIDNVQKINNKDKEKDNSNFYYAKKIIATVIVVVLAILLIYLIHQQNLLASQKDFVKNVQDLKKIDNQKYKQEQELQKQKLRHTNQQQKLHGNNQQQQKITISNKQSNLQPKEEQKNQSNQQQTHSLEVIKTDSKTNLQKQIIKTESDKMQKRYVYGDPIDFTKIPKKLIDLPATLLTLDNLDKAAQFYNLLGKDIETNQTLKQIADMEIEYYDKKYQITQFQEEIQICVFILSYNNEPQNRYKASLDSVFQQNYENYFVVYVNDASLDKTGQLVQKYMDQSPLAKEKMTLINNKINKKKSRNQYELAHQYCKPGAIMFPFDGDDALIGRQVFKLLNAIYQKNQARFVYLNFLEFIKSKPSEFLLKSGHSRQVPRKLAKYRGYRNFGVPLHLRTWVSDIFLNISEADYKMNGQFVDVGEDIMVMYTLQQLAGGIDKVFYIPQIVYAYNQDTGINDSSDEKRLKQRLKVKVYAKKQKKFKWYSEKVVFRLKKPKQQFKLPVK